MVQKIAQCFFIVKQNFEQIATLSFGEKEFLNERECVLNIALEFRNSREGIIIISPPIGYSMVNGAKNCTLLF